METNHSAEPNSRSTMTVIQDLPVELLCQIFEHLYTLSDDDEDEEEPFADQQAYEVLPLPRDNDLRDPTLFPCTIARVSQRWNSIVSFCPKYWTRFAFDLALSISPILDAPLWSEDQSFDVLVFDSNHSLNLESIESHIHESDDRRREKNRVGSITKALLPHLNRCHSLEYDVSYSTSLPPLPLILSHLSEAITSIKLKYRHGPNNVDFWTQSSLSTAKPIPLTSLEHLSIDVATFISTTRLCPHWLNNLKLDTLELSQYEFQREEGEDDTAQTRGLREFFDYLHRITIQEHIAFRNLSVLDHWGFYYRRPKILYCNFTFEGFSSKSLDTFFEALKFRSYAGSFISCDIPDNCSPLDCGKLSLCNLPSHVDLEGILAIWEGDTLEVISCPSFNDGVLNRLSWLIDDTDAYFPAPGLSYLNIRDCDNFTFDALRNFIVDRRGQAAKLVTVHVSGKAPVLTAEQAAWFEDQPEGIQWG